MENEPTESAAALRARRMAPRRRMRRLTMMALAMMPATVFLAIVAFVAILVVQFFLDHARPVVVADGVEIKPFVINHGTTFTITCDTTTAGVPITDAGGGIAWSDVYCENNSTTSAFWGWPTSGTLDTAVAPCISTTTANCLGSSFSVPAGRYSGLACKTASSTAVLKCNAGGP